MPVLRSISMGLDQESQAPKLARRIDTTRQRDVVTAAFVSPIRLA